MNNKSNIEIFSEMFTTATTAQVDKIKALPIVGTNVLKELAKEGINFTWETIKEHNISQEFGIIEVRLYIPGHVLYGRNVYALHNDETKQAHLYALYDAIEPILGTVTTTTTQPAQQQPQPQIQPQQNMTQPLSNEEIMNIVQQNSAQQESTKITTAQEFNEDKREEIPFNDLDMSNNELNDLLTGNTSQPQQQQTQPNTSMKFSPEQIQAMIDFKKKYNITTDEVLGSYINAWNNKLSKKEELNGMNVNAFLEWTNLLGKAPL